MNGLLALHGGGEYIAGDEAAMDALLAAAQAVAGELDPVVAIVPTAAARGRPDLAVATGERAFRSAAARAAIGVRLVTAPIVDRAGAADRDLVEPLELAHLVHLPGGDPDLIPAILRGTPAWAAILGMLERGGILAGASAGAMALGERVWTSSGPVDGLGLLPGAAVLPHFDRARLAAWRAQVDGERALRWIGIDEQTAAIGCPGTAWSVAGRGRVRVFPPGAAEPAWVAESGAAGLEAGAIPGT